MTSPATPADRGPLDRLQQWALGAGIVALLVCALAAPFSAQQFFRAYLAAFQFWMCVTLGALVVLMIYHLTGGAWGFVIRRTLEAATRTLPLLALLFVPIAFGLSHLYIWARPEELGWDLNLQHKQIYLNVDAFLVRAVVYFACWLALVYFLNRGSRAQDRADDPAVVQRLKTLSGVGLVIYGITITFAAVDWVMSLQPTFRSTIFGPLVAASSMLAALALAVIVLARLASRPPLADVVSAAVFNDLGNLLLTFLVIWAYMVFFQFVLVWIANLRYEVIWYLPRSRDGWQWVAWALFVFGLFIPFFALLLPDVKRNPPALARVAALMLFMQLVFTFYQVMPAFAGTRIGEHWMDFLTPIGLGGLWVAYFLRQLNRRPLLTAFDLNREKAVYLWNLEREEREEEADA